MSNDRVDEAEDRAGDERGKRAAEMQAWQQPRRDDDRDTVEHEPGEEVHVVLSNGD
jgi:hypothetical protein